MALKPQEIQNELSKFMEKDRIAISKNERILYSHDVAPVPSLAELAFKSIPEVVVRPKNAEEISKIVKFAIKNDIPITPRGGASWGLGGCVPTDGGIILDLTSMNRILEIDENNLTVSVESGITWKVVYDTLWDMNLFLPAYTSSAPSATVGGWINTGGVGIGAYKYGGIDSQVRSLEVVLPNGKIINTGFKKVVANASGYDLNHLFIGSEGTLGIITKATLKIYPKAENFRALSYGFPNMQNLAKAVLKLTRERIVPYNVSFVDGNHLDFMRQIDEHAPTHGGMLNIALEDMKIVNDFTEKIIDRITTEEGADKKDKELAMREWEERSYELRIKRLGPGAIIGSVFIPVNKFGEMIEETYKLLEKLKLKGAITGVVVDRNTIDFMPYYITKEADMIRSLSAMSFMKKLGDLALKNGGHPAGLGLFFASNLKKMHDSGAVKLMHDLKATIDLNDIINPGKLTEGVTRYGFPIPRIAMDWGMDVMAVMKRLLPREKTKVKEEEEKKEG